MAFSKSLPKGQIPVGCQICETNNKIAWKCNTCDNLMCNICKIKIHSKIGINHKVISIKEIGRASDSLEKVIEFKEVKQSTMNIRNIHFLAVSEDGSLWIGDNKTKTIQHIKIGQDKVTTLSTYKTKVYGLATSPSGSTYIVRGGSTLGIINPMTGQIIDSKYNVEPWRITSVHVTRDNSVIVGAMNYENNRVVIVMNNEGKQIKKYEHDKHKKIFKYPETITTTSHGNIVVGDRDGNKVVVVHPGGQVGYYHGHPDINSHDKPMDPRNLLTTSSDNILVLDYTTKCLHKLNNEGDIITYYNPKDIGIIGPYSLALASSGNIYLGCTSAASDQEGTKAKLYELKFLG